MGLPRPPGDFDRIYSPPEPPETARRSRRTTVLAAAGALAAVAVLVFLLLPFGNDGGGPSATGPTAPGGRSPSASSTEPVYTALPPACRSVSAATVRRVAPGGGPQMSGNSTFSYCAYGSRTPAGGKRFRWLEIDARLYPSGGAVPPVESARRHFGIKWTLAGKVTEERTVVLERQGGIGDQAFRWFKTDRRLPIATGQVAVRTRNAVITVSYSERTAGEKGAAAQRQRCLAEAAAVAREVLGHLR